MALTEADTGTMSAFKTFIAFTLLSTALCAPSRHEAHAPERYVPAAALNTDFRDPLLPTQNARIVGGYNAPFVPSWMGSIRTSRNGGPMSHICGAVLLNKSWVLTAAHCFEKPPTMSVRAQPRVFEVWFGGPSRTNTSEYFRVRVASVVKHPDFNENSYQNDLALLKLAQPTNRTAITWQKIPPQLEQVGTLLAVTGWGQLTESSLEPSATLKTVALPVVDQNKCVMAMQRSTIAIRQSVVCAGPDDGGKDACVGDSGGPMHFQNTLVGIVSWGIGCARKGKYGVYTRVSSFLPWITSLITKK
eukprot:comp6897_c1_seq1/m.2643 comp6897_c1_seq1/g.2643  ORF comp6897_c1_seq1/g.2643 comp6897_c1_seq1/m.2643 type:complete len:303 (-) comp6897_c1_seq1:170-1078(-)